MPWCYQKENNLTQARTLKACLTQALSAVTRTYCPDGGSVAVKQMDQWPRPPNASKHFILLP